MKLINLKWPKSMGLSTKPNPKWKLLPNAEREKPLKKNNMQWHCTALFFTGLYLSP